MLEFNLSEFFRSLIFLEREKKIQKGLTRIIKKLMFYITLQN